MSDVHGNPNDMREFAAYLNELSNQFKLLRDATRSRMNQLNQSWRDRENAQFVELFERDLRPLEKLIHTAEEYRSFLIRKAQTLDVYLNTKR